MSIMHRRARRGNVRTATSARAPTRQPAALDAASVHLGGLARGRRVSGPALAELLNLAGGER